VTAYVVETYLANRAAAERPGLERRAREAADQLSDEGSPVRFGGSLHLLDDEICFFEFEADSDRLAARAARLAGLETLRVVEATLTAFDASAAALSSNANEGETR
jgi:hypothetical protein